MNAELSLADKLYKSFEEGVNGDHFFPNLPDFTRQEYRKAVLALTEHWCYHFPTPGPDGKITLGIQSLDQAQEFVNFFALMTTGKPGRLFQRIAESIKLYGSHNKDKIYNNCIAMLKREKSRSEIDGNLDGAQKIKPFIKLLKNEMKSVPIVSNSDQMLSKSINDMKEFIELTSFMWVPGKPVEYISWRDENRNITDDPSKVVDKVPSLFPQWVQADDEEAFSTIYNRELEARGGVDIEGSVFTRTLAEYVQSMIVAYELATPAKARDIKLIQSAEKFLSWLLNADQQINITKASHLTPFFKPNADKLIAHFVADYRDKKPSLLAPMLDAMKPYLTIDIVAKGNQTVFHNALKQELGEIGTRQALSDAILRLGPKHNSAINNAKGKIVEWLRSENQ
jgi:hypothetical protein